MHLEDRPWRMRCTTQLCILPNRSKDDNDDAQKFFKYCFFLQKKRACMCAVKFSNLRRRFKEFGEGEHYCAGIDTIRPSKVRLGDTKQLRGLKQRVGGTGSCVSKQIFWTQNIFPLPRKIGLMGSLFGNV